MARFRSMLAGAAAALALSAGAASAADVMTTLSSNPRYSTLVQALRATGLDTALTASGGEFTLFAPTDEAFQRLPANTLSELMQPENRPRLETLVRQHIVFDNVPPAKLNVDGFVPNGNLDRIPVRGLQQPPRVGNAQILANTRADNGYVYTIDRVIMP